MPYKHNFDVESSRASSPSNAYDRVALDLNLCICFCKSACNVARKVASKMCCFGGDCENNLVMLASLLQYCERRYERKPRMAIFNFAIIVKVAFSRIMKYC
jgi:hypothetical protein